MRALARRPEPSLEAAPPPQEARVVFRLLAGESQRPGRRRRWFLGGSIAVHVAVLGLLGLARRSSPPAEAPVRVTLVAPASLPGAAPAPASRPSAESKPLVTRTTRPKPRIQPLVAPKEVVPVTETSTPVEEAEPGDEGEPASPGAGAGIGTGSGGGAPAAIAPPPPPPPPPPPRPAGPVFESESNVRRHRIAGHDPVYPAQAERNGIEGVVVVKVVISADGRVADLVIMQTHPVFEATVRDAIAGWRFSPHLVNGRASTVFTIFRFTFKLA